jgi:pilus assembly protein CpaF
MNEEIIKKVKEKVRRKIDLTIDPTDEKIYEIIEQVIKDHGKEEYLKISTKREMTEYIFNSIRRLDVIQPLIDDKSITEIMVNGPNNIFIEKNGSIQKVNKKFESITKLEDIIQQIVSKVNRVVNESTPICDARLLDGSRISIVLPPVALNGPILTIRKFPEKPITIEDLISWSSISEEVALLLEKMVKAKYNIFISGGTGSGKTTFLNVLSNFIPKDERIITIEDSAELQIVNATNLVSLETRNKNIEGKGEVTIRDLIKSSLRMRPDRIIVGEVRGGEAIDMLQAMNTGHDGSLSTGHANGARDMLSRLETMILTSSGVIPLEAIRKQIASAIDIIIHLGRLRDKSRKVLEVCEVEGYKDNEIILNTLYRFKEDEEQSNEEIYGSLKKTNNKLIHKYKFDLAGIKLECT